MKKPDDIIIDGFLDLNLSQVVRVPIIAVYENTKDYPGKFVARLWDIRNRPTRFIVLKDSLEEIRRVIPKTMKKLLPDPADDPVLVETYI